MIKIIDNFLSDKKLLENFFDKYITDGEIKFSFTNRASPEEPTPHSFCTSRDTTDFNLPLIYELYKKILTINDNSKFHISRWRINIHPTGFDGVIHTDGIHQVPTYLYCCTPNWQPNWGGEFIVFDKNKEARAATSFKEDRLIIFDGSMPHRAVGPTRLSSLLRVTLAYQCEPKNN
jgi:hypothetical protein